MKCPGLNNQVGAPMPCSSKHLSRVEDNSLQCTWRVELRQRRQHNSLTYMYSLRPRHNPCSNTFGRLSDWYSHSPRRLSNLSSEACISGMFHQPWHPP